MSGYARGAAARSLWQERLSSYEKLPKWHVEFGSLARFVTFNFGQQCEFKISASRFD
jgi:hypothetical protein